VGGAAHQGRHARLRRGRRRGARVRARRAHRALPRPQRRQAARPRCPRMNDALTEISSAVLLLCSCV
jgi:hypothetical protein